MKFLLILASILILSIIGMQESFAELRAFSDIKDAKHEVDYTILGTISSVGYDGELIMTSVENLIILIN